MAQRVELIARASKHRGRQIKNDTITDMIRGNFIGAAIVAIIYTIYILWNPLPIKWQMASALVILNALTIVLLSFALKI